MNLSLCSDYTFNAHHSFVSFYIEAIPKDFISELSLTLWIHFIFTYTRATFTPFRDPIWSPTQKLNPIFILDSSSDSTNFPLTHFCLNTFRIILYLICTFIFQCNLFEIPYPTSFYFHFLFFGSDPAFFFNRPCFDFGPSIRD